MLFFTGVTNYLLPAYNQTYVTGIEVKRMNQEGGGLQKLNLLSVKLVMFILSIQKLITI